MIEEHKTHQKPGVYSGALFLAILFPPVGFLAFKDFFLLFGFPIISVAYLIHIIPEAHRTHQIVYMRFYSS